MEFFHEPKIDWMGIKWYFISLSLALALTGILSMVIHRGLVYGIDFRGGTVVNVKLAHTPDVDSIRKELDRAGLQNATIQGYGAASDHGVMIGLDLRTTTSTNALDTGKQVVTPFFRYAFDDGVLAVLFPILVLISPATRLDGSGPAEERFAALRLSAGRHRHPGDRVGSESDGVSAFCGAILGVVIFLLIRPALAGQALIGTRSRIPAHAHRLGIPRDARGCATAAIAALFSLRRVQVSRSASTSEPRRNRRRSGG